MPTRTYELTIEPRSIDLMTGRACEATDQLPVAANGMASKIVALGIVGGAIFLCSGVSPDLPAPRTGSNIVMPIEVFSSRIQ